MTFRYRFQILLSVATALAYRSGISLLAFALLVGNLGRAQQADASAVATATFRAISISGTASVFGANSKIQIWEINLCSTQPVVVVLPRQRIMLAAPVIQEIPNQLADDLITRQAYADKRTVVARWFPLAMTIGGAYFTAYGIAKDDRIKTAAGYAGGVVGLLSQVLTTRAPNPQPYLTDLMPAFVTLQPIQCATSYVASSVVPKTELIGPVDIRLPK